MKSVVELGADGPMGFRILYLLSLVNGPIGDDDVGLIVGIKPREAQRILVRLSEFNLVTLPKPEGV